jgi:hypothetical protein
MTGPMTDRLTGRCHCGGVAFTLPAASAGVLACHCQDCQRMHGNFNAFVAAPIAEVTLPARATLVWYQSSPDSRRAFCGTCGGRVLKEVTPAGRWLISAGLIDPPLHKRIIRNLWEASKPDWYDLPAIAG